MAKKITQIPATKSPFTEKPIVNPGKRKVCGYARVSTDNEDQETSYTAQMEYYEEYIKARADWEFVGMYSDEGISGTSLPSVIIITLIRTSNSLFLKR